MHEIGALKYAHKKGSVVNWAGLVKIFDQSKQLMDTNDLYNNKHLYALCFEAVFSSQTLMI